MRFVASHSNARSGSPDKPNARAYRFFNQQGNTCAVAPLKQRLISTCVLAGTDEDQDEQQR